MKQEKSEISEKLRCRNHHSTQLGIVLTSPDAKVPRKGTPKSIGLDLASTESFEIPGLQHYLIDLGVKLLLPDGAYGRIANRSSISMRGITVLGGIIDPDYTGKFFYYDNFFSFSLQINFFLALQET